MNYRLLSRQDPNSYQQRKLRKASRLGAADWFNGGLRCTGEFTYLSTSGGYLETPVPAQKGASIQINFRIASVKIEATAIVVHQTRGVGGMGIHFLKLTREQEAAIASLLPGERNPRGKI